MGNDTPCKWCGSSRHLSKFCRLRMAVREAEETGEPLAVPWRPGAVGAIVEVGADE